MNDKIKTGDVVQLKSGGPLMTVGRMGDDEEEDNPLRKDACECSWFDERGRSRSDDFFNAALRKVVVETADEEIRAAAEDVYRCLSGAGHLGRGSGKLTRLGRALGLEVA